MFTPSLSGMDYFFGEGVGAAGLSGADFNRLSGIMCRSSMEEGKVRDSIQNDSVASSNPVSPIRDLRVRESSCGPLITTSVTLLSSLGAMTSNHFCEGVS